MFELRKARERAFFLFFLAISEHLHYSPQREVWTRERSSHWWEDIALTFTSEAWMQNFRMSQDTFSYVCEQLKATIQKEDTIMRKAICVKKRVAITLWFLATGTDYRTIGHLFGVSKATVCLVVKEVCSAIVYLMLPQYIKRQCLPIYTYFLLAAIKQVCKLVSNHSEMDATARVLMLVMEAAWDMDNIAIQLQPSFVAHSTFTDFLIHINQFSFIELKRVEITTDLEMPTKQTAQALREAHIILLEKNAEHVTFALTNFRSWSFGRAKKVGVQIQMDKTCTLLYNEYNHGKIVCMIKHLIKGTWPN